jgi:hypothetical protein
MMRELSPASFPATSCLPHSRSLTSFPPTSWPGVSGPPDAARLPARTSFTHSPVARVAPTPSNRAVAIAAGIRRA